MPNRPPVMRWIRITSAVVTFAFGALHIASGLSGPRAIKFGTTPEHYYQVVVTPSPNFWMWGVLGLSIAAFLFAVPKIFGEQK